RSGSASCRRSSSDRLRSSSSATSRINYSEASPPAFGDKRFLGQRCSCGSQLACSSQGRFQFLALLLPAGLLVLLTLLESLDLRLDGRDALRVFVLGLVQRRLRLRDRLLPPFAILFS